MNSSITAPRRPFTSQGGSGRGHLGQARWVMISITSLYSCFQYFIKWLTTGRTQQRASWPIAAQFSLNSSAVLTVPTARFPASASSKQLNEIGLLMTTYDRRSSNQQHPAHQQRSIEGWSRDQECRECCANSGHWVRRRRQRQRELRQRRIACWMRFGYQVLII